MANLPRSTRQWVLRGTTIDSLMLEEGPIPEPLGDYEVLVRFHAVSLNYRDLKIIKNTYQFGRNDIIVPLSDGAGEVVAIGPGVTRFKVSQRVTPTFIPSYIAGPISAVRSQKTLGATTHGVSREYGTFLEENLVEIPASLSYVEASTLPCAALTAWNALYGDAPGRTLKPGDTVLTQGTGGVSVFALQFAKAGGAEIISTTSSPQKASKLKELGATHVINYKEDSSWGISARRLTHALRGVDFVIEIGGSGTIDQSAKACAGPDAMMAIVGERASTGGMEPSMQNVLARTRRILVGSRIQFEDMNRAIETNKIKPVIDEKIFAFHELKEALAYLESGNHLGKVVLRIE